MSLFGALFTGVSGLGVQAQSTSMIANNIANVNTVGFKRSEASFFSLVTTEGRSSIYSPGTVQVNRIQQVDQQGPIQQTSSATDAAVSGNGFFTVKRSTDAGQEFLYTRSGQFSEDSQGLLRNTAGFVLYAWPLDANGQLPANQGDLTSLVPADVAFLGGLTRPTGTAELSLNLDAAELDNLLTSVSTDVTPPDFTRGLTVFDSLGQSQVMTFEFSKTYGPHGTAGGTVSGILATDRLVADRNLSPNDRFEVSFDGGPVRIYEITDNITPQVAGADVYVFDVEDIINDINTFYAGPPQRVEAFLGNDGEFVIQRSEFALGTETLDLDNTVGTPLNTLGINVNNALPPGTPTVYTSDDLVGAVFENGAPGDNPPYSSESFPAFAALPGNVNYNNRGWWQVNVIHPNGTSLNRGLINFNGDGSLNALPDAQGNVDINLNNIDWGNGSNPQTIDVAIERFSQFAGNYDVIFSDQNGAELGLRTGVEITRDGFVVARFSNGATANLYKIPLVTFSNQNGLTEVSGTAYSENEESGEENLREAGRGGAGFLEPSTIESSNVDLADEFAKLIVSQRAFSANTRVINTVDQMTEDLLRLR